MRKAIHFFDKEDYIFHVLCKKKKGSKLIENFKNHINIYFLISNGL